MVSDDVTTLGYDDFYHVTTPRRMTACFAMGIGMLMLALVAAQLASTFVAAPAITSSGHGRAPGYIAGPGVNSIGGMRAARCRVCLATGEERT